MKGDYLDYKIIVSHEAWRAFKDKYPNCKELGMDYWTVRKILSSMFDLIMEKVYNSARGFKLPYTFGVLRIIGVKVTSKRTAVTKFKSLDYSRTDNYIYGLYWIRIRTSVKVKWIRFFNFKTAKLIRNKITSLVKNDEFLKWIRVHSRKEIFHMADL